MVMQSYINNLDVANIRHTVAGVIDVKDTLNMEQNDIVDLDALYLDKLYAGGTEIALRDTMVSTFDGNVLLPNTDDEGFIGHPDYRYSAIFVETVFEGDHVFIEKSCPLCNKEFKEGEALINYVLSNTEEGTRTIPVHLTCISKSENQTKAKHDLVIQKLKDIKKYIDPIISIAKMKKMGAKLRKNKEERIKNEEVKMEKIDLKDGKKGILISKKGHFRVFSEEELMKLEKRCLDRLAEVQKYLNELNK